MIFIESLLTFSFLRPLWLLALPAICIIWFSHQHIKNKHMWDAYIANDFLKVLSGNNQSKKQTNSIIFVAIGLALAIIALSGPSIKTNQQRAFSSDNATIIIADASLSMLSTDISPSRKTWAQLKIQEIVKQKNTGLTALIMYSADAHVISPLTRDSENIAHLTQVIEPEILPLKGSNPESAFILANELFEKNKITKGNIIWITDGIEKSDINKIANQLNNHQLATLVVGTTVGAPIKFENGQYLKNGNDIIIPVVNTQTFDDFSKKTNHPWQWLTRDNLDLNWLSSQKNNNIELENEYIDRVDLGFYLGLLSALFLITFLRPNAHAFSAVILAFVIFPNDSQASELWKSLDKQGVEALESGQYDQAAQLFENPKLKAYAHLKNNELDQAIEILEDDSLELNADDYYNLGQAYAKKQQFEQALENFQTSKSLKNGEDVNKAIDTTNQLLQLQQTQTQTSSETSTETSTDTSTDTQTSTDTSTDTQSSTQTSTDTSTDTQSSTQTSTETSTETSTDSQTDTSTDTNTDDDLNNDEKRELDIKEDLLIFYKNQFQRQFQQNNRQQFSEEGPKW